MRIHVDASEWPLVVYTFPDSITDDAYAAFLVEAKALLDKQEPHVMVMDLSRSLNASARQRRMAADFNTEHESLLKRFRKGSAFVVRSSMIRGVLTAIFWLRRPPYAYVVTTTREEAIAWARNRVSGQVEE